MLLALLFALLFALPQGAPPRSELEAEVRVPLVSVIDGDTLVVLLDGREEHLRLLSVDTEEKLSGRPLSSPTKPQTVFGQETALWAQEFFAALGPEVRLGLAFPEGRRRDAYGRLLAHVLLPDGRDFNLLLVREGKSPYFDKYGKSRVLHEAFAAAQAEARARHLGIWDPATNRPKSLDLPAAQRPYDALLPWWSARAAAIEAAERAARAEPGRVLLAEDPSALERAWAAGRADPARRVRVFAAIERFYEEKDGSLTALLRAGDAGSAVRASVPAAARAALEPFLRRSCEEFRQNYLWVEGALTRNERGYLVRAGERDAWSTADPAYPPTPAR